MKKIVSLILSIILIVSVFAVPVANAEGKIVPEDKSKVPVINIRGDGEPIVNKDGKEVLNLNFSELKFDGNTADKENVKESILNVITLFIKEGLLTGKWDNYYAALQKEVGELFGDALLDENGNAVNGTDITPNHRKAVENSSRTNFKNADGYYRNNGNSYRFWYDWRLDPMEIADELNDYIKSVKKATGEKKVALVGMCLGTNVVFAYLSKYGTDDICGVGIDGGISNGSDVLTKAITGHFSIDGDAINRFIFDVEAYSDSEVDDYVTDIIDYLQKSGTIGAATAGLKATLYYRLVTGVTSALALSTCFTWPSYWAGIKETDYETAKNYVFGPEGSEKRQKYAGLIAKIDNYDMNVRCRLPELLKSVKDAGGNLCILAKYGSQIFPITDDNTVLADQLVTVKDASFGATTTDILSEFDDNYMKKAEENGTAKYISPDKQVDASTCLYPDYSWFIKNASHTNWTHYEFNLLVTVSSADRQLTIDDTDLGQYMVFDNENRTMLKMTEENCNTYHFDTKQAKNDNKNFFTRFLAFFRSFMNIVTDIFKFINSKDRKSVV